ncbi:GGDEF domain-containing protein [Natronincola ferrireducens]|uniref:Diguanylate cyclase (GGDEF) domain-containing protein n=1 Tax=Natronincola ferrireducens TaxID=393762 RepID=A0A1G9F242_9FIRM|nr:GGDEF domain-containing protein [Natronincola ferrireducens]SDK82430.1 diguanylate cyclase (GGDEF) domain-containing protein [Natronincola ferrireducens]
MVEYISYFTVLCFSFLMFVFILTFYSRKPQTQIIGYIFGVSTYLCILFSILLQGIPPLEIISLIEVVFMTLFFVVFATKSFQKYVGITKACLFAVLIFLTGILIKYGYDGIINHNFSLQIILSIIILLYMGGTTLGKKEERNFNYIFLWLLVSNLLQAIGKHNVIGFIVVGFKLLFYYSFYHYFYKKTYKDLGKKIKELEALKNSYHYEVKKELFHMELQQERLMNAAYRDAMTETYNKNTIMDILGELITLDKQPISLLMFDIDNFKCVNDFYGHIVGDECIKKIVEIVKKTIRTTDYVGRYGGDEFIILLPNTDIHQTKQIAESFKEKIGTITNPKVTVSIGIACYPKDGETVKELIEHADKGLYFSKKRGKNTVSYGTLF